MEGSSYISVCGIGKTAGSPRAMGAPEEAPESRTAFHRHDTPENSNWAGEAPIWTGPPTGLRYNTDGVSRSAYFGAMNGRGMRLVSTRVAVARSRAEGRRWHRAVRVRSWRPRQRGETSGPNAGSASRPLQNAADNIPGDGRFDFHLPDVSPPDQHVRVIEIRQSLLRVVQGGGSHRQTGDRLQMRQSDSPASWCRSPSGEADVHPKPGPARDHLGRRVQARDQHHQVKQNAANDREAWRQLTPYGSSGEPLQLRDRKRRFVVRDLSVFTPSLTITPDPPEGGTTNGKRSPSSAWRPPSIHDPMSVDMDAGDTQIFVRSSINWGLIETVAAALLRRRPAGPRSRSHLQRTNPRLAQAPGKDRELLGPPDWSGIQLRRRIRCSPPPLGFAGGAFRPLAWTLGTELPPASGSGARRLDDRSAHDIGTHLRRIRWRRRPADRSVTGTRSPFPGRTSREAVSECPDPGRVPLSTQFGRFALIESRIQAPGFAHERPQDLHLGPPWPCRVHHGNRTAARPLMPRSFRRLREPGGLCPRHRAAVCGPMLRMPWTQEVGVGVAPRRSATAKVGRREHGPCRARQFRGIDSGRRAGRGAQRPGSANAQKGKNFPRRSSAGSGPAGRIRGRPGFASTTASHPGSQGSLGVETAYTPPVPAVTGGIPVGTNPIDAFIRARLAQEGLFQTRAALGSHHAAPARVPGPHRASADPEQVDAFLRDTSRIPTRTWWESS